MLQVVEIDSPASCSTRSEHPIRLIGTQLTFNQALQSVFKGRTTDSRGRETAIERCDVSIQDQPDKTECRLIVKMKSKHGIEEYSQRIVRGG